MTLKLYNTLARRKDDFKPLDPANVRMYVCGPTVYDYAHIGNARPIIVFDVLFRLLRHLYGPDHVTYVRNITDVDDKINARAAEEGVPIDQVTARTIEQFHKDIAALGVLEPTVEPRATQHIVEMRELIERLVASGFAYVAEDHVLFSPAAMNAADGVLPRYGALANRSLDEMLAGARVDVAPYKREAMDFVLWKPSKEGEPGWPSPCGIEAPGRPGWHIECSAMSWKHLGETFDIHGGGIDLVFPHHENEVAQSCCAFGLDKMAQVWMHNGFLQVEGEKMSKSLGNFVTIHELLETDRFGGLRWPGEVLHYAMLFTHYRQPLDWTVSRLEEAGIELADFATFSFYDDEIPPSEEFVAALCDDLNTPRAIAELRRLLGEAKAGVHNRANRMSTPGQMLADDEFLAESQLASNLKLLGFDIAQYDRNWLQKQSKAAIDSSLQENIDTLIAARIEARKAKNWAEADRIRGKLDAMGIQLMDGKDPETGELVTTWEVKR